MTSSKRSSQQLLRSLSCLLDDVRVIDATRFDRARFMRERIHELMHVRTVQEDRDIDGLPERRERLNAFEPQPGGGVNGIQRRRREGACPRVLDDEPQRGQSMIDGIVVSRWRRRDADERRYRQVTEFRDRPSRRDPTVATQAWRGSRT